MPDNSSNNKRIAKNTAMLYIRMLFTMAVSLYTSRVVLKVLGVEDYGVYNAVGGIVTTLTVLSGALSAAISRFLTFELGKNDEEKLKRVFSSSLTIQLALCVIVLLVGEGFGIWFLNNKMDIPDGRMGAANWVLQFSILTFIINTISIPYNAAIIAHEKMSAFAYIGIVEVVLKLAIVYLLLIGSIDKLILYAGLLFGVAVSIQFIYFIYCTKHFGECKYVFIWDKKLLKEMLSYAGWSYFGNTSFILMGSGLNLLINVFFGVVMNAARGIATQVENAVGAFVNNFTTALNPQIIKSYASRDIDYMYKLIFTGARYSYYLMLFLSLPILIETDFILDIWLDEVPDHAATFVQLTLIAHLISTLSNTMIKGIQATGNIKLYQILVGGIGILSFGVIWILYKIGLPVTVCYFIIISMNVIQLVLRLLLLQKQINMSINTFCHDVLLNVTFVTLVSIVVPGCLKVVFQSSTLFSIMMILICLVCSGLTIIFLGMKKTERLSLLQSAVKLIKR